jgi:hypothetical protein
VARCSAQTTNVALFYFCGHGLNKTEQFLLPEDFGDPGMLDRWQNNINFDKMRVGMRSCKAKTQLFFVDACRETPFGMLDQVDVTGDRLISSGFADSVDVSAVYYAAMQGKQAYGPDNDVTYFGQAVLKCLNGTAAKNPNGEWIVTTASLGGTLPDMMSYLGKKHKLVLTCTPMPEGIGVEIHKPAKACVIASVACKNQPGADSLAEIVMKRKATVFTSKVGENKPLEVEVEPGDWTIEINFPGGEFPAGTLDRTLTPPIFEGVPVP